MAPDSGIFVGWNRPVGGREAASLELFQRVIGYYTQLQATTQIESFEAVGLDPHGGDLNGYILIRGERAKLDALQATTEWIALNTEAAYTMMGFGALRAWIGEGMGTFMGEYAKVIAKAK